MPPLVSINLCCYNGEQFLEETLASLASQTFRDWDLVAVNDGSSDGTEAMLQAAAARGMPLIYQYQTNRGLGASRQRALELSTGELIAFIDQDDLWDPEKLERQVRTFDDPDVVLCYSDVWLFGPRMAMARAYRNRGSLPQGRDAFRSLLVDWPMALSTVMVRKAAVNALDSGFDPAFKLVEEKDLFLRLALTGRVVYLDHPLACWRVHDGSATHQRFDLFATENEALIEKLERSMPDLSLHYPAEVRDARERIAYQRALALYRAGRGGAARGYLAPLRWRRRKYLLAYLMTFLPAASSGLLEHAYWRWLYGRV